jgi:ubiquinone/menaquinone biosynthesis C-methylase UbiE
MSNSTADPNLPTYNSPQVADYYAGLNYLTPCEHRLFDEYLQSGMAILDLGVGGGRTTAYLSAKAGLYVGFDYAPQMIAACRKKFPQLEFHVGSAADLSLFASSSFNAVVMAFNGMDYVIPDESRFRALREIHRVLQPEGFLIFSSHNPRSILVRPSWNRERVRHVAKSIVDTDSILFPPTLWTAATLRIVLALLQTVPQSLARAARRLLTKPFWRGEGYWMDPAHGGLMTHLAVPKTIAREAGEFGFRLQRVLGDDYPRISHLCFTRWYYYVFSKPKATGAK